MKKLMFGLVGALALAASAEVESGNIVGFTSREIEANTFYLVGVQYNKCGGTAGSIDMNDLISLSNEITPGLYDDNFATAPQILVSIPGAGYKTYYYISDATDDSDEYVNYNCWADGDGYILKNTSNLILGEGFWFKSPVAGTITAQGEVTRETNISKSFPAGVFYIMSNPLPTNVSLANITTTGLTPGLYDDNFVTAPQILVSIPGAGYKTYYYISDATDDSDEYVNYDCWADGDGYILDGNQIQIGESFWIKAADAGSLGFGSIQ